jgi:hypothetical protein
MKKIFLILLMVAVVHSCASKAIDVKSPCVSNDDGPCGSKRPINNWWLNKTNS